MGFVLDPEVSVRRDVRRVAREQLGEAIELLDRTIESSRATGVPQSAHSAEETVHEVRKRCKSVRGLARLVRPALGDDFRAFDRRVRDAADELSSLRDAHAVLSTLDTLLDTQAGHDDPRAADLRSIRERRAATSAAATEMIAGGDRRLRRSRDLLDAALERCEQWRVPRGFEALADGLAATYRLGRRGLRVASQDPTDRHLHEWRKSVKYLWYQARLLHDVAPSVMGPLVQSLDDLGEALGDDHDLAVLAEQLADQLDDGGDIVAERAIAVVRAQQDELRRRAFRLGRTVYAETGRAFVARVESYWTATRRHGSEVLVGGIADIGADVRPDPAVPTGPSGGPGVERERKFLVEVIPDGLDLTDAVAIRQGYLAGDGDVSVRVRDAGVCTLTVKWRLPIAGSGERGELEWEIARERFESIWPATAARRVVKTRHRVPIDEVIVELDVFHEALDGLVVAEVEFENPDAMSAFAAPDWFGPELTDDRRYTNAVLAVDGPPSA
jgi:CYTH domain-containing protein/CHAD domain-containing protein